MRKLALTVAVPVLLASATASAHFSLTMPVQSAGPTEATGGKGSPPCGPDTTEGTVTPVMGGSMLAINVTETVRHGGFYRVALALTSCHKDVAGMPKCFPADNTVYDSANKVLMAGGPGTSDHADIMNPAVFPVLADGLFMHDQAGTPEKYAGMVAIPNVSCDKCTLQVIEFMHPHGSNGDAGFFYHHCADLKITQDPAKPPFPGTGGGGAGGAAGAGGSAGAAGSATGGTGGASGSGGTGGGTTTGGTDAAGTSAGGTALSSGTSSGGNLTAGGSATTAGTGTLPSSGAGGSGTAPTTAASSNDSGGCGIAGRRQGGATALAALGLLFALVRRRRAR